LNELLESDDKFGFIIMDGNGALFGTLSGNCFPGSDHELLTADGFRSLDQVQRALAREGKVAIACPRDDGRIEMRDITEKELLVHEGEHQHVAIRGTDDLNGDVDLLPTTNHRMWVRTTFPHCPSSGEFSIVQAGELPLASDEAESLVELMASCPEGLHRPEQELPFMDTLDLHTRDQFDAFLQLYGQTRRTEEHTHSPAVAKRTQLHTLELLLTWLVLCVSAVV
jgi:hypothetical protein